MPSNGFVGVSVTQETGSGNAYPFNLSGQGVFSMRYQQIYSRSDFTQAGVIDDIRFRRSSGQATFTSTPIDVKITLGYAARTVASASANFADNIGPGTVTVFDGLLTLTSSNLSTSPQSFDVVLDVANLFDGKRTVGLQGRMALQALHPDNERFQQLTDEDRVIVSEPLSDLPGVWIEVPEATALIVQRGPDEHHPFSPTVPAEGVIAAG